MNKKIWRLEGLARLLPVSYENRKKSVWVTGLEIKKNRKRLKIPKAVFGDLKKHNKDWRTKKFKMKELWTYEKINHRRKLLRAYSSEGDAGISKYVEWLHGNNKGNEKAGMKNQAPNYGFAMRLLGQLVDAGVGGIWKAIAIFMAAYFAVFGRMGIEEEE
jgi:hypothetical protein